MKEKGKLKLYPPTNRQLNFFHLRGLTKGSLLLN